MSTLLIVDDHVMIRAGVRALLNRHSTVDVCGEARDGEEAIQKVGELHPDIVLLDIQMPRMNGIQAARQIHRLEPSTKIVFFTSHPQSVFDESAMCSNGFVSKLSAETELIPILSHLLQSTAEELGGPLKYQWQRSVVDTFAADGESSAEQIAIAEEAIAARLTDVRLPGNEELAALSSALQALEKVQRQKTPKDER
jgi:YesN/AraC family two-component response regulator